MLPAPFLLILAPCLLLATAGFIGWAKGVLVFRKKQPQAPRHDGEDTRRAKA